MIERNAIVCSTLRDLTVCNPRFVLLERKRDEGERDVKSMQNKCNEGAEGLKEKALFLVYTVFTFDTEEKRD